MAYFYKNGPTYNWAIWFLLSLTEVFFLFYLIGTFSGFIFKENPTARISTIMLLSFMIGIGGLLLSYHNLHLHLFFDTSMTALPMFAFGWWLNNCTDIVKRFQRAPKWLTIILAVVTICLSARLDYSSNTFSTKGLWCGYLCAIIGFATLSMLSIWLEQSKFGKFMAYCGRNTLTILCFHMPLLLVLSIFAKRFSYLGIPYLLLCFIFIMAICLMIVPIAKRFLPHVTNQKPLIH